MIQKKIVVELNSGLQAQVATAFVKKASLFKSEINILKKGRLVACKSIMGVMCLAIRKGEKVTIIVDGIDENKAIGVMETFLLDGK